MTRGAAPLADVNTRYEGIVLRGMRAGTVALSPPLVDVRSLSVAAAASGGSRERGAAIVRRDGGPSSHAMSRYERPVLLSGGWDGRDAASAMAGRVWREMCEREIQKQISAVGCRAPWDSLV